MIIYQINQKLRQIAWFFIISKFLLISSSLSHGCPNLLVLRSEMKKNYQLFFQFSVISA